MTVHTQLHHNNVAITYSIKKEFTSSEGHYNNKPVFEIVSSSLRQFTFEDEYGTDYNFFNDVLYPCIKKDSMQHGEFLYMRSFPTKRIDNEFVGEVFDENENTTPHHTEVLKNYQKM